MTIQRDKMIEHIFHACCALHNFLLDRDDRYLLSTSLKGNEQLQTRLYHPQEAEFFQPSITPSHFHGDKFLDKRGKLIGHFAQMFEQIISCGHDIGNI